MQMYTNRMSELASIYSEGIVDKICTLQHTHHESKEHRGSIKDSNYN